MKGHLIKSWLPLAITGTILVLALYVGLQQTIRQSANDPQIQLAEDGAAALEAGAVPAALVGTVRIDMSKSLAPFVAIYDDEGTVIASNGYLAGTIPAIPSGVLEHARTQADNRITWQPASTTRIAAVVRHFGGAKPGFVVAGRSLREVEVRESFVTLVSVSAWVCMIILTLVASLYAYVAERKEEELELLLEG